VLGLAAEALDGAGVVAAGVAGMAAGGVDCAAGAILSGGA
jgi:hypothetical protein